MSNKNDFYSMNVKNIHGNLMNLGVYRDKVLLVVNVASKCGFTPQYEGLEKLYRKYKQKGFEILAFPCNQFGSQEPGDAQEIQSFCKLTYDVTFPLFAKIDVNGKDTDPLYQHLKSKEKGILNTEAIKWNFTKFLVNRSGDVLKRFAPTVTPEEIEKDIEKDIEKELEKNS